MKKGFYNLSKEDQEAYINRKLNNELNDQYNTIEPQLDEFEYRDPTQINLKSSPKKNETFESYLGRLKVYIEQAIDTSMKTHVNGPKGSWYSHRQPMGCPFCPLQDIMLLQYHVLLKISQTTKKFRF